MGKVVSIVIATYNMEQYIRRCLDSLILSECYMDKYEVLVINDGSKDNSSIIAHEYEEKYPQTFRVIDKENGNYGSCINRGIDEAKGKYFRILDADDWFDTESFKKYINELDSIESDLVLSKFNFVSSNDKVVSVCENIDFGKVYNINDIDFSKSNVSEVFAMHGMTYKTSLLKKINLKLQTGISYTDTEFCFYPLFHAKSAVFLDIVLYQYDISRDGQTMSVVSRSKSLVAMTKVSCRMIDYVKEGNSLDKCKRIFLYRLNFMIYSTILLYMVKSDENESLLRNIDKSLKECDKEVFEQLGDLTNNKIPYVHIWRKYGTYNTNALFYCYNKTYQWLKNLLGKS